MTTKRCASVFKTCENPYYTRCRIEEHEHGGVHTNLQGISWLGVFEEDYSRSDAVRLPFYFDVTTDERGTKWVVKDVASQQVITRSPGRYATIDEAHEAMRLFQATIRG